jgi:hypothetical protein
MKRLGAALAFGLLLTTNTADAARKVNQVVAGETVTAGDIIMDGVNTITGLPGPTADGDVAPKVYVDGKVGTNPIGQNLTNGSGTLTPSSNSKHITLFPSSGALSTGVIFNHSFNAKDADFAVGTDTGTFNSGSPVVVSGALDLTNGNSNFEASSIRFNGDNVPYNMGSVCCVQNAYHVRIMFRPNFTGNPPSDVTLMAVLTNQNTANSSWYVWIDTVGDINVRGNNSGGGSWSGRLVQNIIQADELWVAGELYQLDFTWYSGVGGAQPPGTGLSAGQLTGWLNGHWAGASTMLATQAWANQATTELVFGGEGGADPNSFASNIVPGVSNHKIEGVTIWGTNDFVNTDIRPHYYDRTDITSVEQTAQFAPEYDIDGASSGEETIDTIDGSLYEAGETLTLENGQDGATFTLVPATTLGSGKLDIRSRFTPRKAGDRIVLQYTGSYWTEVARHFVDDGSATGRGVDAITLAAASNTMNTLGGSDVTVFGSATALPPDLNYLIDYSDNSLAPDFTNSGASVQHSQSLFETMDADPFLSGGELYLNDAAAYQRSAHIYVTDGAATDRDDQRAGTFRLLVTPEYSGTPASDVMYFQRGVINGQGGNCPQFDPSGDAGCRSLKRLQHRSANGNLRWEVYNSGATNYALEAAWSPTAGQEYEIEVSYNFDTGNTRIFIDGVLAGTNATLAGSDHTYAVSSTFIGTHLSRYILGGISGANNTTLQLRAHRWSRHRYSGFAAYRTEQHTANYTPTGLPGVSAAFETINTIPLNGYYQTGQVVRFFAGDANRFKFTDAVSPTAGQLSMNGDWEPTTAGEWIDMRVDGGGFWVEQERSQAVGSDALSPYVPRIQDATPETATFTAVISETHIVDLSGGSFTANLPPVASGVGQIRFHVNGTAGQLTVDPNASELIDGKLTLKIRSGTTTITNDGTEWHILQRTARSPNRVDPAQITANQDPYNPADWDNTVTHLYIDSDASRTIFGFAEGNFVEMDEVIVVNDGLNNIVIAHDAATTASNSVLVDGNANYTLEPNSTAVLLRDGTVNRWRLYAINQGQVNLEGATLRYVDAFFPTDPPPTSTTYVPIDLSKDSAPANAVGALIAWSFGPANGTASAIRPNSGVGSIECSSNAGAEPQGGTCVAWFSPGTQQFEAAFTLAPGALSPNVITVYGWLIEEGRGAEVYNSGNNLSHVDPYQPTDPEPTNTTWVTIDLSKDGAPTNAIGALVSWSFSNSTGGVTGSYRRSPTDTAYTAMINSSATGSDQGFGIAWFAPGTQSFQAQLNAAPTIGQNQMEVTGYVLEVSVPTNIANLVTLDTPDAIGDWPGTSVITPTDVDLSDDGVPVGAEAVMLRIVLSSAGSAAGALARKNGETITGSPAAICVDSTVDGSSVACDVLLPVDSDRLIEAWFNNAWTATNNRTRVGSFLWTTWIRSTTGRHPRPLCSRMWISVTTASRRVLQQWCCGSSSTQALHSPPSRFAGTGQRTTWLPAPMSLETATPASATSLSEWTPGP